MIVDHGRTTTENVVLFLCSQLLKGFLPRTQVGQHFEASVRNGDTLQCPPLCWTPFQKGNLWQEYRGIFLASIDSLGNSPLCSLHQTKGSASLSMLLKSKYDCSSETTSCSGWEGASLPFAALRKLPKVGSSSWGQPGMQLRWNSTHLNILFHTTVIPLKQ